MRVPTDQADRLFGRFKLGQRPLFVGACSFEERCRIGPTVFKKAARRRGEYRLVKIRPVSDGFPDVSAEISSLAGVSQAHLESLLPGVQFIDVDLLANEDGLLHLVDQLLAGEVWSTVVLDISSFPKRFFCFLVLALMRSPNVPRVVVLYTPVPIDGYAPKRLAEDPLPPGFLPGFGSTMPPQDLVLSLGFESLGGAKIVEEFLPPSGVLHVLLPYPPHPTAIGRTWDTLREILRDQTSGIRHDKIAIVSAMDIERVFSIFESWRLDSVHKDFGLLFAPFGPKPHTLAMALFCQRHQESGIVYTQPKVYNPDYSHGGAAPLAYVVKWDGVACYDR